MPNHLFNDFAGFMKINIVTNPESMSFITQYKTLGGPVLAPPPPAKKSTIIFSEKFKPYWVLNKRVLSKQNLVFILITPYVHNDYSDQSHRGCIAIRFFRILGS